jgi:hypothetical protein
MLIKTQNLTAKIKTGYSELDDDDFKSKGEPVIYLTNDVAVNELVFSFINNTGDTLVLKSGKPAKELYPDRISCADGASPMPGVIVYSIRKP